ncbi:BCD family MFS transporter [Lichenifustis flavocetrariae]|uniref:BCD family MFS transporter n=1 Tax=Lichenifustis flavocetrariae TaxID=2949735 RepID=A0AA41YUJ4_9HYPH|nr:BCD family MFS transporter [Lichenifustis flavocetrariae]MCW6507297.1 BCD family MFS transporter [Lichenifustis flavocetrariae]
MSRVSPWVQIVRLGLVQASIGAIVVFATSTLNRVMVVELALPAIVPGALVALHYAVQMLRPRWGHGSDRGGRRTPWILGGMMVLATGSVLAALATAWMKTAPLAGITLGVTAFLMIGIGVGSAGTSLLLLLARQAGERRRAAAAAIVWMMMIAGFLVTAAVVGQMLAPFSVAALVRTSVLISGAAVLMTCLALWRVEPAEATAPEVSTQSAPVAFLPALREVWTEPDTRGFTLFVFFSMLAYSAQELILEPFAGSVFALPPAESAKLAGFQHSGLLAGMVLVAVLGSAIGGPRLGSMRLWTIGGCLASMAAILGVTCVALAGASASLNVLRCAVVLLGCANGAFSIAAVASMMQLAGAGQPGREGVRMGLWGAAQALAFALGGVVGTGSSDLARQLLGSPAQAYTAVFLGESLLFGLAAWLAAGAFPRADRDARVTGSGLALRVQDTGRWAT